MVSIYIRKAGSSNYRAPRFVLWLVRFCDGSAFAFPQLPEFVAQERGFFKFFAIDRFL